MKLYRRKKKIRKKKKIKYFIIFIKNVQLLQVVFPSLETTKQLAYKQTTYRLREPISLLPWKQYSTKITNSNY